LNKVTSDENINTLTHYTYAHTTRNRHVTTTHHTLLTIHYSLLTTHFLCTGSEESGASFRLQGEHGAVFRAQDGGLLTNYVRYKETPRMKLLQLRCVKPYLFNAPIPLNEAVIKNSELYKTIFQQELHETMARIGGEGSGGYVAEEGLTDNKVSVNKTKVRSVFCIVYCVFL